MHGHHGGCRDGVCVPYCPVRPHQFGFYDTQWRRWPGQQILQVSAERDAAPVDPPRSAVPGPTEESLNPQGDGEAGASDTADSPSMSPPARQPLPEPADRPLAPPEPARLEPAPQGRSESQPDPKREPRLEPQAEPAADSPAPAPEPALPAVVPPQPAPETQPRPEDENLFEVLSGWRARRKFPVSKAGGSDSATTAAGAADSRPVGHAEPSARQAIPRVPFDPAAETRRLRSAR